MTRVKAVSAGLLWPTLTSGPMIPPCPRSSARSTDRPTPARSGTGSSRRFNSLPRSATSDVPSSSNHAPRSVTFAGVSGRRLEATVA